jgi:hypothetical protein
METPEKRDQRQKKARRAYTRRSPVQGAGTLEVMGGDVKIAVYDSLS